MFLFVSKCNRRPRTCLTVIDGFQNFHSHKFICRLDRRLKTTNFYYKINIFRLLAGCQRRFKVFLYQNAINYTKTYSWVCLCIVSSEIVCLPFDFVSSVKICFSTNAVGEGTSTSKKIVNSTWKTIPNRKYSRKTKITFDLKRYWCARAIKTPLGLV